jgi:hypothetical protein
MRNLTSFQVWVTLENEDIVNEEPSPVTLIIALSDDFHATFKSLILRSLRQLVAFFLTELNG